MVVYGTLIDEVMSNLKEIILTYQVYILYIQKCTEVLQRFTSPPPGKVYTLFVLRFKI